ncbi:MAG: prepilin-type N-terminal cleavage/methylation domain-containing protein [Gemmatimonadetes bacterium]|nr:prepilin-type N-terminal cleavage/methylation domain-containing protein [Gemmatimonadota bacterium]MBI3568208.1 prepilin-type N-terminal cleavage/methylation domain-containing protein [Gemmatimonadota bacterium]MBI3790189.1 prepilin-type N-terminal cleavage/methylation domain-containing protein [Gemmatimonadota bacterium]
MTPNRTGFTLIELLIVVVIIGILAAIAIPKFANTKEQAYITSMRSDLRTVATAQEAYYNDNGDVYATSTTSLGTTYKASAGVTIRIYSVTASGWRAFASHAATTHTCRIRFGSTISPDGAVVCQ